MPYNIYLSSNTTTPFLTINDDTFDTTSTSVGFIGRKKTDYGNLQQQDVLWMLENFANSSAPNAPVVGQMWYDIAQSELKVYQGVSGWRKTDQPTTGTTPPVTPSVGQPWYDTTNNLLKTWNGSSWIVIGPPTVISDTYFKQVLLTNTTNTNATTELWVNGVTGSRVLIPTNTTYTFDITISARRTDTAAEFAGWKISGVINNTAGQTIFVVGPAIGVYGNTSAWSVNATADNVNDSLNILVTGQAGKVINFVAVANITICQ